MFQELAKLVEDKRPQDNEERSFEIAGSDQLGSDLMKSFGIPCLFSVRADHFDSD